MKICTACKKNADDNSNFCTYCGSPLITVEPEAQVIENTYVENIPVYPCKKPSLGLKITAMTLSITGFSFLIIGLLYTFIGLMEQGLAFAMAVSFSLFFLPLSIVGLSLSKKCIIAGDNSAFSRVGKILGLLGIVFSAVSLFVGFIGLF